MRLGDRGKGDGETADFAVHLLFLRHPAMWGNLLINPGDSFSNYSPLRRGMSSIDKIPSTRLQAARDRKSALLVKSSGAGLFMICESSLASIVYVFTRPYMDYINRVLDSNFIRRSQCDSLQRNWLFSIG